MTREELEAKLENLQRREFLLQMCDHWDRSDYDLSWELHDEIRAIKKQLKEMGAAE